MSDNNYVNPFTPVNRAGKTGPLDQYSNQPPTGGNNDSPFYKSAAPSISLPKGGGAIKGVSFPENSSRMN